MDSFHDEDFSASVAWETGAAPSSSSSPHAPAPDSSSAAQPYSAYTHDASPGQGGPDHTAGAFTEGGDAGGAGAAAGGAGPGRVHGQAVHDVQVRDGKVELEGTSDTFVSYLVTAKVPPPVSSSQAPLPRLTILLPQTDLPGYGSKTPSARRRFHDFVFLRDGLVKDFPASVVPPLPEKHRMGAPHSLARRPRLDADMLLARRVRDRRPLQPRVHRAATGRVRYRDLPQPRPR